MLKYISVFSLLFFIACTNPFAFNSRSNLLESKNSTLSETQYYKSDCGKWSDKSNITLLCVTKPVADLNDKNHMFVISCGNDWKVYIPSQYDYCIVDE